MKNLVSAVASGCLFGIGLAYSGMTQPAKIIHFFDFQAWDPSLALVMLGALAIYIPVYRFTKTGKRKPTLSESFIAPEKEKTDPPLVVGAALFGIGWGLSGFCPGPAIVSLGAGSLSALSFMLAMTLGSLITSRLTPK